MQMSYCLTVFLLSIKNDICRIFYIIRVNLTSNLVSNLVAVFVKLLKYIVDTF